MDGRGILPVARERFVMVMSVIHVFRPRKHMKTERQIRGALNVTFIRRLLCQIRFYKISGNPAPPTTVKNCAHSASVRCAFFTTSLRVARVSIAFLSKKRKRPASGSRKFCAQLARKKLQNPRKFSARRARKSSVNSTSVVSRTV